MRTDGLFWRALNAARAANLADDGQEAAVAASAGLTAAMLDAVGALVFAGEHLSDAWSGS